MYYLFIMRQFVYIGNWFVYIGKNHRFTAFLDSNLHTRLAIVTENDLGLADPDFPLECKISAIWRRLTLIFAFYILNVRHISTAGLFHLLT